MSVPCPCQRYRFSLTRASSKPPRQEHQVIIELPRYQSVTTNRALRTHVPGFYVKARREGDRRVRPMAHIGNLYSNFSQVADHEEAVNWIFLHVSHYQQRQCQYHPPPPVSFNLDPIAVLLENAVQAGVLGDNAAFADNLEDALKIFWTVGSLLQTHEFGHSYQMLDAYLRIAHGFIGPVSLAKDPTYVYYLAAGLVLASDGDSAIVRNITMLLPLDVRVDFENFLSPIVQMGDMMAYHMLATL